MGSLRFYSQISDGVITYYSQISDGVIIFTVKFPTGWLFLQSNLWRVHDGQKINQPDFVSW